MYIYYTNNTVNKLIPCIIIWTTLQMNTDSTAVFSLIQFQHQYLSNLLYNHFLYNIYFIKCIQQYISTKALIWNILSLYLLRYCHFSNVYTWNWLQSLVKWFHSTFWIQCIYIIINYQLSSMRKIVWNICAVSS